MKHRIFIIISLTLIIVYLARVIDVNKSVKYPISIKYSINEEVPIENDFVSSLSKDLEGCNILVTDAKIFSYSEFNGLYELDSDNIQEADTILLIEMYIYNNSLAHQNHDKIDLMQFTLQDRSYITIPEEELIYALNDIKSSSIPIVNKSERKIIIPFVIKQTDLSQVSNHFDLVITLYPHKKSIKLNYV